MQKKQKGNLPVKEKISSTAKRIRALRRAKDLTQEQLGESLCLGATAVQKYESGAVTPPTQTIAMLADYFSVSMAYLLGESDVVGVSPNVEWVAKNDPTAAACVAQVKLIISKGDPGKLRELLTLLENFGRKL